MINKYVVFIGLCSYNLFNFGSDYSDFLKKNKLILSENQKIVFAFDVKGEKPLINDFTFAPVELKKAE